MSFAHALAEDRRLTILRLLTEAPGRSANASVLQSALGRYGFHVSRDQVIGDCAWLAEQMLVDSEDLGPVVVVTLTQRGLDVAEDRARHPGVKRPAP